MAKSPSKGATKAAAPKTATKKPTAGQKVQAAKNTKKAVIDKDLQRGHLRNETEVAEIVENGGFNNADGNPSSRDAQVYGGNQEQGPQPIEQ